MLNSRTGREIARVYTYEAEWRIKTNQNKFAIIALATHNPTPLPYGSPWTSDEMTSVRQKPCTSRPLSQPLMSDCMTSWSESGNSCKTWAGSNTTPSRSCTKMPLSGNTHGFRGAY
ncbi:hypothetical protein E2C01_090821 [Portunus trituberculatus]|uniref:Uncharacterized protein n=1 Tax=Portunus trituberculatus TaxID=210409 RepID=A0A5B7JME3_PORTR|nr:hypothetical protein [Portunus trituberculatus]